MSQELKDVLAWLSIPSTGIVIIAFVSWLVKTFIKVKPFEIDIKTCKSNREKKRIEKKRSEMLYLVEPIVTSVNLNIQSVKDEVQSVKDDLNEHMAEHRSTSVLDMRQNIIANAYQIRLQYNQGMNADEGDRYVDFNRDQFSLFRQLVCQYVDMSIKGKINDGMIQDSVIAVDNIYQEVYGMPLFSQEFITSLPDKLQF